MRSLLKKLALAPPPPLPSVIPPLYSTKQCRGGYGQDEGAVLAFHLQRSIPAWTSHHSKVLYYSINPSVLQSSNRSLYRPQNSVEGQKNYHFCGGCSHGTYKSQDHGCRLSIYPLSVPDTPWSCRNIFHGMLSVSHNRAGAARPSPWLRGHKLSSNHI